MHHLLVYFHLWEAGAILNFEIIFIHNFEALLFFFLAHNQSLLVHNLLVFTHETELNIYKYKYKINCELEN